jgi:hypothetical protein
MPNPDSIQTGQGDELDIITDADGVVYLKGAGDSFVVDGAADLGAPQLVQLRKADTGTVSSVASSASSVTLLAANTLRKGATITNDSTQVLYVKLAASAASTSSYTVALAGAASAPFAYYECPYAYSGEIRGIWASANGNARVTELV